MIRTHWVACLSLSLLFVTGCGGPNQAPLPSMPANSQSAGAQNALAVVQPDAPVAGRDATVVAIARLDQNGGADFITAFPHRALQKNSHYVAQSARAETKLYVDAYLYPSYASHGYAYWTGSVPVEKGGSLRIRFGKVVPAKNEWLVLDAYQNPGGYAEYLGSEAGVFNVGKGSTTLIVTPATTLLFQALMALEDVGLIDASDLENPKLMTTIKAEVRASKIKPDPGTGIFSNQSLYTFVAGVQKHWQRTMTLKAGSSATMISVANDTSDLPNMNARSNLETFLNDYLNNATQSIGTPCYTTYYRVVGKSQTLKPYSCANLYGTGTGNITLPVFGGKLIVGASNGAFPFMGVTTKVSGGVRGTHSTIKLTLVPTQATLTTYDPQDWAFGVIPYYAPNTPNTSTGIETSINTIGLYSPFSYDTHVQMSIPGTYSAANPKFDLNTWNPWGLRLSNFDVCSYSNIKCRPLRASGALQIIEPFADYGTNGTYYNWQGQSGTVVAYSSVCHGYVLTPSGSTITMTTNTASWFTSGQAIYLGYSTCGAAGTPATGGTVVVTATDGYGTVFSGENSNGVYDLSINTSALTQMKSVTVKITLGPGSPPQIFLSSL